MKQVFEVGDRFVSYIVERCEFRVAEVRILYGARGKKREKPRHEYVIENVGLHIHPAMRKETIERLRHFEITDDLLNDYINKERWIKQ